MRKPTLLTQIILGFVLALIIMPHAPANRVQAQWAVHDPVAYTQRMAEFIKEAERWIQTVEHYSRMVETAARQVTTLGGILDLTERIVANNNNIVATMSNIGRSVRGVFALKRQIEALVHYRIRALHEMDDRLRNGIFNPQADLEALDRYLRESIGRASQDRVATLEQIANMDSLLDRWRTDLQMARGRKAALVQQINNAEERMREEEAKPQDQRCAQCISDLRQEIQLCHDQIARLDTEIRELLDKIEERLSRYNVEMRERGDFATDIRAMEEAWDSFFSVREDIFRQLEQHNYGREDNPTQ